MITFHYSYILSNLRFSKQLHLQCLAYLAILSCIGTGGGGGVKDQKIKRKGKKIFIAYITTILLTSNNRLIIRHQVPTTICQEHTL
jgi:hypothetical protein